MIIWYHGVILQMSFVGLQVALKAHMNEVHTDSYKHQCKVCGKMMKSRNSLYGHMNQFHSENLTIYACQVSTWDLVLCI